MTRVLFLSNGHGEDAVAARILDRLREHVGGDLSISAWPMVGHGDAYRARGVPLVGEPNTLPSAGFGTLEPGLFVRDLRAGWIATHWRQLRAARALGGRFDLAVAVGDVVPLSAAIIAGLPLAFVGIAKSSYYDRRHGFTRVEKRLLRRYATITFPRDELTTRELDRAAVPNAYTGNPMMDDLVPSGESFGFDPGTDVIALLPGSRADALDNAELLLLAARATRDAPTVPTPGFVMAVPAGFDEPALAARAHAAGWSVVREGPDPDEPAPDGPEPNEPAADEPVRRPWSVVGWRLTDGDLHVRVTHTAFPDALHRSSVVVGMAGTANEQAIGLGRPLVTLAGGVQGDAYVRMKMAYFGDAAIRVDPTPAAAARAVSELLQDPERRERMAAAGRERMGEPGGSDAIARRLAPLTGDDGAVLGDHGKARRYVVEVHDAHPGSLDAIDALRELVPTAARDRIAYLVVPRWEGRHVLDAGSALVQRIRDWGGECVLHGYTHSLGPGRWESLFFGTERHAEFAALDCRAACARLERSLDSFRKAFGERPRWFCAPRWSQSPGTTTALRRIGIDGHMERDRLVLRGRQWRIPAVTFDFGTRPWQRVVARWTARRRWRGLLAGGRPFRLALHPSDLDSVRTRSEIETLCRRLGEDAWTPMSLVELDATCGARERP